MENKKQEIVKPDNKSGFVKCKYKNCTYAGRIDNVKRHETIHVDTSKRVKWSCECGKNVSNSSALKRHKINSCQHTKKPKMELDHPPSNEYLAGAPPIDDMSQTYIEVPAIPLEDIATVEYLVTLKNGTTIQMPAVLKDKAKLFGLEDGTI